MAFIKGFGFAHRNSELRLSLLLILVVLMNEHIGDPESFFEILSAVVHMLHFSGCVFSQERVCFTWLPLVRVGSTWFLFVVAGYNRKHGVIPKHSPNVLVCRIN